MKLSHLVRSALFRMTRGWTPRVIGNDDGPYLSRYYIVGRPHMADGSDPFDDHGNPKPDVIWPTKLPFGAYLHRFHVGDRDRDLHNHPWTLSISFVLAGGYIEERLVPWRGSDGLPSPAGHGLVKKRLVKPFSINVLRATDFHRVDLIEEDAWSLFVTFRRFQSWGFWDRVTGAFIPWREYLDRDAVNARRAREQERNDRSKTYGMSEQLADALGDDEMRAWPKVPDFH